MNSLLVPTSPFNPEVRGQRFQFLDGLRGVAALAVTFLHFRLLIGERTSIQFPWLLEVLFKNGDLGVQLFFVLSGFVIAYSLRFESISFDFIINFFIRRSIRLDPPYWITLGLLSALIVIGLQIVGQGDQSVPSFSQFFLNAFYLPDLLSIPRILPVSWTLCLEFQFYLIFVALLKAIQSFNLFKSARQAYSSSATFFIFGGVLILSLTFHTLPNYFPLPWPGLFIPYWYSFFTGCITCWAILKFISVKFFWIVLGTLLFSTILRFDMHTVTTLVVALVIFSVAYLNKLNTFLSSALFQYLGKISYSLYLIHWIIGIKVISLSLYMLGNQISTAQAGGLIYLGTCATLIGADIFYRWVELPSLNVSYKFKEFAKTRSMAMGEI